MCVVWGVAACATVDVKGSVTKDLNCAAVDERACRRRVVWMLMLRMRLSAEDVVAVPLLCGSSRRYARVRVRVAMLVPIVARAMEPLSLRLVDETKLVTVMKLV